MSRAGGRLTADSRLKSLSLSLSPVNANLKGPPRRGGSGWVLARSGPRRRRYGIGIGIGAGGGVAAHGREPRMGETSQRRLPSTRGVRAAVVDSDCSCRGWVLVGGWHS